MIIKKTPEEIDRMAAAGDILVRTIAPAMDLNLFIRLIGQTTETVEVKAGTELVNSANSELSTTLQARIMKDLPLATRNVLGLVGLQAGVNALSRASCAFRVRSQSK